MQDALVAPVLYLDRAGGAHFCARATTDAVIGMYVKGGAHTALRRPTDETQYGRATGSAPRPAVLGQAQTGFLTPAGADRPRRRIIPKLHP